MFEHQKETIVSNVTPQRRALEAPPTKLTPMTSQLLDQAIEGARQSARLRMILPLHKSAEATLHRMFNAMQPGTYIPPHRHFCPPKPESILVLRGSMCFITFDDSGQVEQMIDVTAGSEVFGIDIEPGIFHTFLILEPDTVMYEVKPGPYSPIDDKDFATWAPREGDSAAAGYLAMLQHKRLSIQTNSNDHTTIR